MSGMVWDSKVDHWSKDCSKCGRVYTVKADKWDDATEAFTPFFAKGRSPRDGLQAYCRICFSQNRDGRISNGLTKAEMFDLQNGKCALNGEALTLSKVHGAYIDHDHKTGKVRALLCPRCNTLMTAIDNDDWLARAIAYRDLHRKM